MLITVSGLVNLMIIKFGIYFPLSTRKAVTRVSFLVRQGVWGPPIDPCSHQVQGRAHMKLWFYLILQGYFGYENDRTHVIKVVVLVVKITIRLTYGIHGFKKKEHTTISLFNGDVRTKRIYRKQIFRPSHVFYTRKSTQS